MKSFFKSYFWLPALIAALVYFQVIYFGTAWEDDAFLIQPLARDFNLMLETFYKTIPGSHFFPFSFFQCYIINSFFSYPFGFHLYAFLLHIISCILAVLIFYEITGNKLISVLIVSLWTVHPLNVETINRLVCVPAHVPAGAFCLAFLYCFLRMLRANNLTVKILLSSLSIFFFLASITSCEQYIIFPFVLLLIFLLKKDKITLQKKDCFYFLVLPLFLVYIFYIIWRYLACGGSLFYAGDEFITWCEIGSLKDILFRAFWLAPQLFVHYLKLFFWPDFLSEAQADWYYLGTSFWSPYSLFCQFFIFGLVLISIFFSKKIPLFTIGIFWFFVSMIPVIQIIPLFTIVDEHYCYLAILGLFLAAFSLIQYCFKFLSPKILIIVILPVFLLLTWRTLLYLPNQKDRLEQVIARAEHTPSWTKVIYMLEALQVANKLKKKDELPQWLNLGNLKIEVGKWLSTYLYDKPNLWHEFGPIQNIYKYNTYRFICRCLYTSDKPNELGVLMKQALNVKSDSYSLLLSAEFLDELKDYESAWQLLKKAVELKPGFSLLYSPSFIKITMHSNKFEEAEKLIKEFIKLKSSSSYPYLFSGVFYMKFNKLDEALNSFKQAISKDKSVSVNYKVLYFQAADFFLQNKIPELAKDTLQIILSFDPYDKKVKEKLKKIQILKASNPVSTD